MPSSRKKRQDEGVKVGAEWRGEIQKSLGNEGG
jgi:hypothetical protein